MRAHLKTPSDSQCDYRNTMGWKRTCVRRDLGVPFRSKKEACCFKHALSIGWMLYHILGFDSQPKHKILIWSGIAHESRIRFRRCFRRGGSGTACFMRNLTFEQIVRYKTVDNISYQRIERVAYTEVRCREGDTMGDGQLRRGLRKRRQLEKLDACRSSKAFRVSRPKPRPARSGSWTRTITIGMLPSAR